MKSQNTFKHKLLFPVVVGILLITFQCLTVHEFVPEKYHGVFDAAKKFYQAYDHDFSPIEEYYIGRTILATLLKHEKLYGFGKSPLEQYIQKIGYTLAMASKRPYTYRGYRFIVLKSKSPNAYALPEGFILINRGLLKKVRNEEELAGILAIMVSHIALGHPTKSVDNARKNLALTGLIKEGSRVASDGKVSESMMKSFDGVINDVIKSVEKGYTMEQQKEADLSAVDLLIKTGYNPKGLRNVLKRLKLTYTQAKNPYERIDLVDKKITSYGIYIPQMNPNRTHRFKKIFSQFKEIN